MDDNNRDEPLSRLVPWVGSSRLKLRANHAGYAVITVNDAGRGAGVDGEAAAYIAARLGTISVGSVVHWVDVGSLGVVGVPQLEAGIVVGCPSNRDYGLQCGNKGAQGRR